MQHVYRLRDVGRARLVMVSDVSISWGAPTPSSLGRVAEPSFQGSSCGEFACTLLYTECKPSSITYVGLRPGLMLLCFVGWSGQLPWKSGLGSRITSAPRDLLHSRLPVFIHTPVLVACNIVMVANLVDLLRVICQQQFEFRFPGRVCTAAFFVQSVCVFFFLALSRRYATSSAGLGSQLLSLCRRFCRRAVPCSRPLPEIGHHQHC